MPMRAVELTVAPCRARDLVKDSLEVFWPAVSLQDGLVFVAPP